MLSAALAADALAVTASIAAARPGRTALVRASLVFGAFQAVMAAIGAVGGMWMATLIGAWLSWLACAVLVALGLRMLVIADDEVITAPVGWAALLALGLATSVDALAAGVSLPTFAAPVWGSVLAIGVVTSGLPAAAGLGGHMLGAQFGVFTQRVGGVILVGLGLAAVW